jgi:GNAT superfamily N-acetyltransferase
VTGHSLVTTAAKVLDVLGYRRMLRLEWSLAATTRGLETPPGVRLGFTELDEYLTLGHPTGREEAERRLAGGERIMAIWREDLLSWASWIAEGAVYVPYLRAEVPLAARELYHYDGWLRPEVRGQGLTSHLGPELVKLAGEEGKDKLVSHIWPDNVRSLRAGYRNVGRAVGMEIAIRLPGRTVHRTRRWKEPLTAWERPHGAVGRARHLWYVRYALLRADSA